MKHIKEVVDFISAIIGEKYSKEFVKQIRECCNELKSSNIYMQNKPEVLKKHLRQCAAQIVQEVFSKAFREIAREEDFDNYDHYMHFALCKLGHEEEASYVKEKCQTAIKIVYANLYKYCLDHKDPKSKPKLQKKAIKPLKSKKSKSTNRLQNVSEAVDKIALIYRLKNRKNEIEDKLPNITEEEANEYLAIVQKLDTINPRR